MISVTYVYYIPVVRVGYYFLGNGWKRTSRAYRYKEVTMRGHEEHLRHALLAESSRKVCMMLILIVGMDAI